MSWNIRKIRPIRSDGKLKTRKRFTKTASCPTITLLDLDYSHSAHDGYVLTGQAGVAAYIGAWTSESTSNGLHGNLTSSDLPPGFSLFYSSSRHCWAIIVDDSQTFGSKTFNISGTDDNGCPITEKEYTIDVYAEFTYTGPTDIIANDYSFFTIPITGITNPYVANELVSVKVSLTFPDLARITMGVSSPDFAGTAVPFNVDELSGADLTNTIFYNKNITLYPSILTSSAPYTGTWNDDLDAQGFDFVLVGLNTIGDWSVIVVNDSVSTGSFLSATLLFKP